MIDSLSELRGCAKTGIHRYCWVVAWVCFGALCFASTLRGEIESSKPGTAQTRLDWPTHGGDNRRSGVGATQLEFPLRLAWSHRAPQAPQRAWPDPAPRDFWQRIEEVKPRLTHDRAYPLSASNGRAYFGSSSDDAVYCLDAQTGAEIWVFVTGGPVRFSPVYYEGRVYAGSDDGFIYCLDAKSGELIWRLQGGEGGRIIPGNQRMISSMPIRTSVMIVDDALYYTAGVFPEEGVWLGTLDPRDGAVLWKRRLDISPQGYLLASSRHLYIPTGRAQPYQFDLDTGEMIQRLGGDGGAYVLLTGDEVIAGPGRYGRLEEFLEESADHLATFAGNHMIVSEGMSYLHTDAALAALDRRRFHELQTQREEIARGRDQLVRQIETVTREGDLDEAAALREAYRDAQEKLGALQRELESCVRWRVECGEPYALILTGDALIAGGENIVAAYRIEDGERLWEAPVEGIAYNLAAADGHLLVSTDAGVIYSFTADFDGSMQLHQPLAGLHPFQNRPAIDWIMDEIESNQGYALLLGENAAESAYQLAQATEFSIVAIDDDAQRVAAHRGYLRRAGAYGTRVAILEGTLDTLPFTEYAFNLIVAADAPAEVSEMLLRSLRPEGGVALVAALGELSEWTNLLNGMDDFEYQELRSPGVSGIKIERGAVEGGGRWTHLYADAGNTANSGDRLARTPMRVQWFGRPGPRYIIDRHHRPMAPLVMNGRGFIAGDNRIIAFDSYNGTPLWEREVPHSRRVGIPYDAGNMVLTEEALLVLAQDRCLRFEPATGEPIGAFAPPSLDESESHWGYLAVLGDVVLGSGQAPSAARAELSRDEIVEQYGEFRPLVTGRYLFGMDRHTGETLWTYRNGAIINSAIAAGDGRVYLVESRNSEALNHPTGRIPLSLLLADNVWLAALDATTGDTLWEREVDLFGCEHILYLSYARETIVALGSRNNLEENSIWFHLYGFDAASGERLWAQDHADVSSSLGGDHGEQVRHPAIIGDLIVAEPRAYRLRTGEPVNPEGGQDEWRMSGPRLGCGTISASEICVFYRDSAPMIHELGRGREPLSHVNRTGCWINLIAAGGLVVSPEASSGCTCAYPIQASMAFIPVAERVDE